MKMEITKETVEELDDAYERTNMKKIEAALFLAGRWLSLKELVSLTDINPIILRQLLGNLIDKYASDDRAMEIIEKDELWKMDVKPDFVEMVNRLATGTAEFSKAEQETLAVIAYKQPVRQSVIIKIRGNKAYEHVKHFCELGLLRAKKIGRTQELSLTEEFHDYFHVSKPQEVFDHDRNSEEKEEFRHLGKKQANENNKGVKEELSEIENEKAENKKTEMPDENKEIEKTEIKEINNEIDDKINQIN